MNFWDGSRSSRERSDNFSSKPRTPSSSYPRPVHHLCDNVCAPASHSCLFSSSFSAFFCVCGYSLSSGFVNKARCDQANSNRRSLKNVRGDVVEMKEYECVEVEHHKDVGKTIGEYQSRGWSLHTYQTAGMGAGPMAYKVNHYLLFERG